MNPTKRKESKQQILSALATMSRSLAAAKDLVILGEGNTSARCGDETFFVKASGTSLAGITEKGFVEVRFVPVLKLLERLEADDETIAQTLRQAKFDQAAAAHPSVETLFHAFLLTLPGVRFIGHVHPVAVNSLLCSARSREILSGRLFPDEIVVCGPEPAYVTYCDPGLVLAKEIKRESLAYQEKWAAAPKAVLIENHGLIALGSTPREVEAICVMWEKTARILLGTLAAGGPRFLAPEHVNRIHSRPDEVVRRREIRGEKD